MRIRTRTPKPRFRFRSQTRSLRTAPASGPRLVHERGSCAPGRAEAPRREAPRPVAAAPRTARGAEVRASGRPTRRSPASVPRDRAVGRQGPLGQNVTMDEGGTPLLPDSLVYQIFLSLGPADVLAAGLVCRQWQAVSRDEFLWREQFYRYYQVARDVPRHPGQHWRSPQPPSPTRCQARIAALHRVAVSTPTAATSWYEEFRRLYDTVPCVEVQTLREHTDQVLHLSFSHSGYRFASCSKDCTVKVWSNDLTISLLHSADMRPYNWSYTQFSQFNQDDSLLLASGVFLGPHNSSSGEIAVISLDTFALLSRVRNKPYDVFGCWLTETSLISGNLHRIGDITSCSVLWLNNAFQDVESENVNVVKRLFKIQNLNASTIRTVMVADCSRFDSPDLLLDASGPAASPCRVFDLGSDSEDEAEGPAPARAREGLRRLLDGILDGHAQPGLSERTLETKVAELLAQGRTKPPERSAASAQSKLLIFTTGCLTYSPHQIGNGPVPRGWGSSAQGPPTAGPGGPRCPGGRGASSPGRRVPARPLPHRLPAGPPWGAPDGGLMRRSAGIKQILPHQMTTAGPVLGEGRGSDTFFDALDHVIDVHGHIIGMGLSPDNRYLYVNSRAWPRGSVVADPMQPPPIAEEIDLLVFDLKSMREVRRALRAHRAYTPNDECFFIFLDVSRDFVASGAEDRHGYIWDRHYNICLAKLRHQDVVNSVVFSPQEQELLLTASDDATIKAWRSPRTVRVHQAPRPRPRPFFSWFAGQRR
ncbi:F-box/WD repeat-containing protein 5 [Galemys pyrenaicus]|uniref:F-box/WD repeat-containing protein 5 n=1 Tax=Galemys pyrenaicus TaxID=202257 RepID=A0A8J6AD90_GALPY|nr:F-box/WD repeat-containing protein 5 [Galemys pyrenaicus]